MLVYQNILFLGKGWSGGAKVLGKLPVPGRSTNLDYSRARAYCACSRCGWGLFGHFFSRLSILFSFSLSLWETARYRLKYCLKGPFSPKQPTNQPSSFSDKMIMDNTMRFMLQDMYTAKDFTIKNKQIQNWCTLTLLPPAL